MIYALEGVDAAGKATQARLLADRLGARLFGFPDYESASGKALREHLEGRWSCGEPDETELGTPIFRKRHDMLVRQSLMLTNRLEHFDLLRVHGGSPTKHLVLDRYYASGLVYGEVEGLDPEWLDLVHAPLPPADVWILLDVDPAEGFQRRPARRDSNERDLPKLDRVRAGYMKLFASRGPSWHIVDGHGPIDDVAARVAAACGI